MLTKAVLDDVEKYCDFVYAIALDQRKSCYPTYADSIKTKEDFIANARRGVTQDEWELMLFSIDGTVEGWVQYYWIPQDHYLQLYSCNINRGTEQALAELLALLEERFHGYTLYFGFPGRNTEAVNFLRENGFQCIEENWNCTFFFESFNLLPDDIRIARIARDNFEDFRTVYKPDHDTYWNCDRILEQIDQWIILIYYNNNSPVGTVFLQGCGEYYEIFGIEFADGGYREDIYRALLASALNHCKREDAKYLTYFCEEDTREVVQDLGFKCVGKYLCYINGQRKG